MSGTGFLGMLTSEQQRRVLAATRRRRFGRNEVIFHEGDPGDTLHVVDKGHVAIRISTPLGDVVTLTVLGPGDSFGEQALLDPASRRTATAVAVVPAETRSLLRDEFQELRDGEPEIDRILVAVLAEQVRRLSGHLLEALYVPADTRVLRRLTALVDTWPEAPDGSVSVTITQEDLASMAGTTRPTANRTLKQAEAAGVLRLARGRVHVPDPAALRRLAR